MKNYFLIILAIIFINKGWTQNSNINYIYALKIYNLSSYNELSFKRADSSTNLNQTEYSYNYLKVLNPTIAIQWKTKKNNFREIELTNFTTNKTNSKKIIIYDTTGTNQSAYEATNIITHISVRYEYILNLNKLKEKKYLLSFGFGFNPFYKKDTFKPKVSSSFETSIQEIGINSFVTPRFTYFITSKIFIDVNIPICIINTVVQSQLIDNPQLTVNQRKITTANFNELPKIYSARIGVGIKL
jgi:hypothetical protein